MSKGQWIAASSLGHTTLAPHVSVGAVKLDTHFLCQKTYNSVEVRCQKPSATNFANVPPCHDQVLSIIALFVTFFAICSSLYARTTDGSSMFI